MEAAVLPFSVVLIAAIISITINTIGYEGMLIVAGVIGLLYFGFWFKLVSMFKDNDDTVINNSKPPPPNEPHPDDVKQLNGGKKRMFGKKRK